MTIELDVVKEEYDEDADEYFYDSDDSKVFTLQDLLDKIPEGVSYKDINFGVLEWDWGVL